MAFRIESDRLMIREWQSSDDEDFRLIATDPVVMRYISRGVPWTEEQIHTFIERQEQSVADHGFCLGALVTRADGTLIGLAGLQHFGATGDVEIGWWLATPFWGRGLGTEAGRAIITFAFEQATLPRVLAIAHPENRASIRIMEKLGMTFQRRADGRELGLAYADVEVVLYALENRGECPARPRADVLGA